MNSEAIINELRSIEAGAEILKQRSYKLRQKLEDVSTSSSPKRDRRKGLSKVETTKLIVKRRKKILN